MKRTTLIGLAVCLLLMFLFIRDRDRNEIDLVVHNQSGREIRRLVLSFGEHQVTFFEIADGSRVRNRFSLSGRLPVSGYGEFSDYTRINNDLGELDGDLPGQVFTVSVDAEGEMRMLADPTSE